MQSCSEAALPRARAISAGSALPDVAENLLVRQRVSAKFRKRGVDGKGQIEFGIDQRAVQVEDQRAYFGETGDGVPHGSFVMARFLPRAIVAFYPDSCTGSCRVQLCCSADRLNSQEWLSY